MNHSHYSEGKYEEKQASDRCIYKCCQFGIGSRNGGNASSRSR